MTEKTPILKKDVVVFVEGKEYPQGFVQVGALQLPEDQVRLHWSYDPRQPIGWARNFRREGAEIWAEVEFEEPYAQLAELAFDDKLDWVDLSIYGEEVRARGDGQIYSVDVRSATATAIAANPGAHINKIS